MQLSLKGVGEWTILKGTLYLGPVFPSRDSSTHVRQPLNSLSLAVLYSSTVWVGQMLIQIESRQQCCPTVIGFLSVHTLCSFTEYQHPSLATLAGIITTSTFLATSMQRCYCDPHQPACSFHHVRCGGNGTAPCCMSQEHTALDSSIAQTCHLALCEV